MRSELEKLVSCLEKFLGPAISPSELPGQMEITLEGLGGVLAGQSLYFKKEDGDLVIAVLWLWGDGNHITVKIVKKI